MFTGTKTHCDTCIVQDGDDIIMVIEEFETIDGAYFAFPPEYTNYVSL